MLNANVKMHKHIYHFLLTSAVFTLRSKTFQSTLYASYALIVKLSCDKR